MYPIARKEGLKSSDVRSIRYVTKMREWRCTTQDPYKIHVTAKSPTSDINWRLIFQFAIDQCEIQNTVS